jgi:hypothetical protein
MLLAQGRLWRATLARDDAVALGVLRDHLPAELQELRDLRIEVPLERWNLVVRNAMSDRKLLGGILLDFANAKDAVATAVASDRSFAELQRVVLEATTQLLEQGRLVLSVPGGAGG